MCTYCGPQGHETLQSDRQAPPEEFTASIFWVEVSEAGKVTGYTEVGGKKISHE
jgi:hypothetical protein